MSTHIMSAHNAIARNAMPLFYQIFESIKVFCSFDINWYSVPNFLFVELKAFNTKRNLVSPRNIHVQLIPVASNSLFIPLFKYSCHETVIKSLNVLYISIERNLSRHMFMRGTGIICKKIILLKSAEFGMALKWSATRCKQKTEIFLVTRPPTC